MSRSLPLQPICARSVRDSAIERGVRLGKTVHLARIAHVQDWHTASKNLLAKSEIRITMIGMESRSLQMLSIEEQVKKTAPTIALGYCLEFANHKGEIVTQPSEGFWRLEPFEPPHGVPESRMRVLYKSLDGKIIPPMDPANPMPTVVLSFGPRPVETPPESTSTPDAGESAPAQREPLREDLHPAAESEESMERELFSQHIERNEYSNFKLRSETRAIESLYAVIQRMTAEQHVLFQNTLETPRRVAQECKQLVETMGEAMRSFHSMIELQSTSMQTIQKQMELTRVPPPPPPPPDYVGLGKTLLEILRDLGMKAMDSGYVRRPLPARRHQELPEIRDAEFSQPTRKAQPAQSDQQAPSEEDASSEAPQATEEGGTSQGAEELRRVLNRMGDIDVSRAFSSPENFRDMLADLRKGIDECRESTAAELAPAPPSVKTPSVAPEDTSGTAATKALVPSSHTAPAASAQVPPASTHALVQSSKTPLPSSKTPPQSSTTPPIASAKSPPPASSQTALLPSGQTPRSPSGQTPSHLKHAASRQGHAQPHGKRRP